MLLRLKVRCAPVFSFTRWVKYQSNTWTTLLKLYRVKHCHYFQWDVAELLDTALPGQCSHGGWRKQLWSTAPPWAAVSLASEFAYENLWMERWHSVMKSNAVFSCFFVYSAVSPWPIIKNDPDFEFGVFFRFSVHYSLNLKTPKRTKKTQHTNPPKVKKRKPSTKRTKANQRPNKKKTLHQSMII